MAQRSAMSGSGTVADFPYDARLEPRSLCGLDRLRSIPDRKLAEYLYRLHAHAERNEAAQREKPYSSWPSSRMLAVASPRASVSSVSSIFRIARSTAASGESVAKTCSSSALLRRFSPGLLRS